MEFNWYLEWSGGKLRWSRSSSKISSPGSADVFHELFLTLEDDLQEDEISHRQLLVGELGRQQAYSLAKLGAPHISKGVRRYGVS